MDHFDTYLLNDVISETVLSFKIKIMSYWPCQHLSNKFLESCQNNNLEDVKACIQLKVDVNVKRKDCSKYFGLSYAAWNNFLDLCDVLLSHPSIDVNNKDSDDETALMRSCTVLVKRVRYFVLLNYSHKSWSIIKTRDSSEI